MNDFITFRVRNSTVLIKIDPLFPRAQRPACVRAVRGLFFGLRQGDLTRQHLPRARTDIGTGAHRRTPPPRSVTAPDTSTSPGSTAAPGATRASPA